MCMKFTIQYSFNMSECDNCRVQNNYRILSIKPLRPYNKFLHLKGGGGLIKEGAYLRGGG